MRTKTPALLAAMIATASVIGLVAGCATTGTVPVDFGGDTTTYISPANGDGVQDVVSYPLSVELAERAELASYEITVTAADGTVVRRDEHGEESGGWLRRGGAVDAPEAVIWDGRDDRGAFVPDGDYELTLRVRDNHDAEGIAPPRRIVVDNTAPSVTATAPSLLFTPNGDGIREELALLHGEASVEDRWLGTIVSADGEEVRRYEWEGVPEDFVWDGTAADGSPAPEGTYTYTVVATDRAGNTAGDLVEGIALEREDRFVSLFISQTIFSPNGDGTRDTLTLNASVPVLDNLDGWELTVVNEALEPVRTFTGEGEPPAITFDGRADDGTPVDDGRYRAVLRASYAGGQTPESTSPWFTVDTQPPSATVEADSLVFSPDGDGHMDTVAIFQQSTIETEWTGLFRRANGSTITRRTWRGEATNFVWNGTDANGQRLPDGVYTYELTAVDEAGNRSEPATVTVRIDTRAVPVRVLRSRDRVSPNGDGFVDTVTLSLLAEVTEGIDSWAVIINDAAGASLGELAAGSGALAPSIEWDGTLDGSLLPDGIYHPELQVRYEKGTVATALGSSVRIDTTGPEITISFTPELFSPDGDGINDDLTISIMSGDPSSIEGWSAEIRDRTGQLFAQWAGDGRPPLVLRWDGLSPGGELVMAAEDYDLVVKATDGVGNAGSGSTVIPIDIMIFRDGDRLRISSIYFEPYTASFENLEDPEQAARNAQTLDRLAQVLARYPQYRIRIEGHAAHLLWYDPMLAQTENVEVLVPLSFARAEAVRQALVRRGIPASRMTIFGYGGVKPVVPHSDDANRWKNRRVEFILERR